MNILAMDRVMFTIFGVDIYWYAGIITFAILLDFVILFFLVQKKGLDKEAPYDLVIFLLPPAILMARLFSVLFDADITIMDYFDFRSGGMSIVGAIAGGALGLALYCLIKKKNFLVLADILSPLIILGQAIGRWGNYVNQEVYGGLVTDKKLQWFPYSVYIEKMGNYYQALFFYESIFNLIGFVLLITLWSVFKNKKGYVVSSYFMYYGLIRFFLEGLRQPQYILRLGNLPISKVLSGVLFVVGAVLLAWLIIKDVKSSKKLREAKNG